MDMKFGPPVQDPRLGRLPQFDPKNNDWPIRTLVAGKAPRSYTWSAVIDPLYQGDKGACVGFTCSGEAAAKPKPVANITNEVGFDVYHRAQHIDPWDGCEYGDSGPIVAGTSVLAGMKVGKERGWWNEYRWATTIEDVTLAIGYAGPVVLGIDWYADMMRPDTNGRIHPTGSWMGGHAILARGYSTRTGLIRLRNSWGKGWGVNGECFIHQDDLSRLLLDGGEAAIPLQRGGV